MSLDEFGDILYISIFTVLGLRIDEIVALLRRD
jgi:DNA-binding CsgD family transcriptional regulator